MLDWNYSYIFIGNFSKILSVRPLGTFKLRDNFSLWYFLVRICSIFKYVHTYCISSSIALEMSPMLLGTSQTCSPSISHSFFSLFFFPLHFPLYDISLPMVVRAYGPWKIGRHSLDARAWAAMGALWTHRWCLSRSIPLDETAHCTRRCIVKI